MRRDVIAQYCLRAQPLVLHILEVATIRAATLSKVMTDMDSSTDTSNDILHESWLRNFQDSLSRTKDEPTVSDLGFLGKHSDGQPFRGRSNGTNGGTFQKFSCLPILFAASSKSHPATGNIVQ